MRGRRRAGSRTATQRTRRCLSRRAPAARGCGRGRRVTVSGWISRRGAVRDARGRRPCVGAAAAEAAIDDAVRRGRAARAPMRRGSPATSPAAEASPGSARGPGRPRAARCGRAEARGCRRGRERRARFAADRQRQQRVAARGRSRGLFERRRRRRRRSTGASAGTRQRSSSTTSVAKARLPAASRCVVSQVPSSFFTLKRARLRRAEPLAQRAARRVEIDQRHLLLRGDALHRLDPRPERRRQLRRARSR